MQLDDIKSFRQWDSSTPGHPENFLTAGVEVTTGAFVIWATCSSAFASLTLAAGCFVVDWHRSAQCWCWTRRLCSSSKRLNACMAGGRMQQQPAISTLFNSTHTPSTLPIPQFNHQVLWARVSATPWVWPWLRLTWLSASTSPTPRSWTTTREYLGFCAVGCGLMQLWLCVIVGACCAHSSSQAAAKIPVL